MENVKRINKFLLEKFGKSLDGSPKFRVAWSEDMNETRLGMFSELAIKEEIRTVKKYSFLKDRYILEVNTHAFPGVFGAAIRAKKDIVLDGDSFEPLKVFQSRKGEYLKPDLEICEIVCEKWVELVNRPAGQRLTEKKATAEDAAQMKKETKKFFEILNGEDSDIIHQFRSREAVILPGKEFS